MARPVDAVTAAVLKLEMAQREVNALIQEVTARVSADPFAESSHPDFRLNLSELRSRVDQAADELDRALERMGQAPPASDSD
jgi:hypothetical protein